jgi:hypothetical protein
MGEHRTRAARAVAVAAALSMGAVGLAATGAAAQSSGTAPGITDGDVTLGYISSQTGVAAATHKNAHKSCEARVDAQNAGKNPTRQGFVDAIRRTNNGKYDGAGLLCAPLDLSLAAYGKVAPTTCTWFVTVKDGKFTVLNKGKPFTGKLVGNPALIKQYEQNTGGIATTTAPPSS